MAMGLKKVTNFLLGVDEDYEDDYVDEYEYEDEEITVDRPKENISRRKSYSTLGASSASTRGSARTNTSVREISNIRSISPSTSTDSYNSAAQIDISYPQDIDSAREVIDNIKRGVYSIVNLEAVESPLAQRIADFLSGAVDALDGNIRRLSHDMFVITPAGVEITGELDSEIDATVKSSGGINLSWLSSSLK